MKTDSSCIFCKIVAGALPSIKVYEDDATLAFLTIEPVNAGHTLVIPKEHVENIFEVSSSTWTRVQESVRKVACAVEKGTAAHGVNIGMNNREHAGQVVDHIHIHVIPRFRDDGVELMENHARRDEEGEPVAEKIRAAI